MMFFPRRWRADLRIRELSMDLRGALVEIQALAAEYPDGHLPNDPKRLARLLGQDIRVVRNWLKALQQSRLLVEVDELHYEFRSFDAFADAAPPHEPR